MNPTLDLEKQEDHTKNIRAVIFTALIASGIVLLLIFIRLYQPDPLPTVKVVEVNLGFGNPDAGGGGGGSNAKNANPKPILAANNPQPSNPVEAREDDPKVDLHPVNNPNTPPRNTPPNTTTHQTTNNNTPPRQINQNALFGGMNEEGSGTGNGTGNGSGDGSGNGSGSGSGNGSGNGPGTGPGTKPGIVGDGDYVLEGRSCISRPKIDENFSEEGKVVVNIWVDQTGNVTRVSINEAQTNTNSRDLRDRALKAAKKTKFSPNPNAAVEQKGLYVYKFILH